MKLYPECRQCILQQAQRSPQRFTDDPALRAKILADAQQLVSDFPADGMPPELGGQFHRMMSRHLGLSDPYVREKERANNAMLRLLPALRDRVLSSEDPIATATRFCIAANMIDFGAPGGLRDTAPLQGLLEDSLNATVRGFQSDPVSAFAAQCAQAQRILYICDNAGEIVADRLLVEQLPRGRVTVAVRSAPVLNDALLADAQLVGMPEVATVMTTGCAEPGVPLHRASDAFLRVFHAADLIIAKGQGNFETLDEAAAPIWFLLCVKCDVVAARLSCNIGDMVLAHASQLPPG
ncbi:MAG: DUF89 family protein [Myxococcales bacterium]|jgi:uncharacterized protein with ATP-grasp and redox domains|nr:DUF89 family protein [Myxococcales bacterium]